MMKDVNIPEKWKPVGIVKINLFGVSIGVFDTFKAYKSYHEKVLKLDTEGVNIRAIAAATVLVSDKSTHWFALIIPKKANIVTIAHECSHMADFIMDVHGVPISLDNTEIKAYLMAQIMQDVFDIFGISNSRK